MCQCIELQSMKHSEVSRLAVLPSLTNNATVIIASLHKSEPVHMGTWLCRPNVLVPLMLMLQLQCLHIGMSNYSISQTGGTSVNYSSYHVLDYF
jgi:hypothetical protein